LECVSGGSGGVAEADLAFPGFSVAFACADDRGGFVGALVEEHIWCAAEEDSFVVYVVDGIAGFVGDAEVHWAAEVELVFQVGRGGGEAADGALVWGEGHSVVRGVNAGRGS